MAKPTLVLLHGWGMPASCWDALLPGLSTQYDTLALRLPGYGSSPASGVGLDEVLGSLEIRLPEQAFWLGWSLGGTVLTALAARYPQRCSGLILVASSPRFCQAEDWPAAMAGEALSAFRQTLIRSPEKALQRFNALQFVGMHDARDQARRLSAAVLAEQVPAAVLQQGLQQLQEWDVREAFAALQCPTLAVFGELDPIVPAACAEQLRALNPAIAVTRAAKVGHAPMLSHPRWLAQQVNDFIQGVG